MKKNIALVLLGLIVLLSSCKKSEITIVKETGVLEARLINTEQVFDRVPNLISKATMTFEIKAIGTDIIVDFKSLKIDSINCSFNSIWIGNSNLNKIDGEIFLKKNETEKIYIEAIETVYNEYNSGFILKEISYSENNFPRIYKFSEEFKSEYVWHP